LEPKKKHKGLKPLTLSGKRHDTGGSPNPSSTTHTIGERGREREANGRQVGADGGAQRVRRRPTHTPS